MSDNFITCFFSIISVAVVATALQISITPQSASVLINGTLQFQCKVTVRTDLRIVFFFDTTQTVSVFTFYCQNNACFNLTNFKNYEGVSNFAMGQFFVTIKSVPGTYHDTPVMCKAQYGNGSNDTFINSSSIVYVFVPLTSVKLLSSANVDVQKDDNKNFTCQADSRPDTNITWKKLNDNIETHLSSQQIPADGITVKSYMYYTGNVLDNGAKIYCQGEYNGTTKVSEKTTLRIIYAPATNLTIQRKPQGYISAGDTVTLICSVSGGNPLPKLSWNCTGTNSDDTAGNISSISVQFTVNKTSNNLICACSVIKYPVISYRPIVKELLNVYYQPDNNPIIEQFPLQNVVAGDNVTLTCTVQGGNPLATLSWNCTGINSTNTIGMSASYGISFIVSKQSNNMICTCFATHFITSYRPTKDHQLIVYYPPDKNISIQIVPEENVTAGSYVTLTCSLAGGNPLANLTWDCFGNNTNTKTETTAYYSVGFTVDKTYNNKICTCSAKHYVDSYRNSKPHLLIVYFRPGIPGVHFTTKGPWFEGNSTNLTCLYEDGNPTAHIRWTIGNTSALSNDDNPIFEIHSLSRYNNSMSITCTVYNSYAEMVSENVFLDVQYFPSIMVENTYIVTNESRSITLLCNASGNPVPKISWRMNTKEITKPNTNKSVLYIENINRTDDGIYTCNATSKSGKYGDLISTKDTQIVVNYAPDVTVTKDLLITTENTTVNLSCNANGKPSQYAYEWKHTFAGNVIRVFNSNKNTLLLKNISYNDFGKYECVVNNGIKDRYGKLNQTNNTKVEVQFGPVFVLYDKITTGKKNRKVSATVDFIAFPGIDKAVKWRNSTDNSILETASNIILTLEPKNISTTLYGINVSYDKYGYSSSLNFPFFEESQDGFYSFEVSNALGVNNITLRIVFSDRPQPPTLFSASVIGSTSVIISWKKGFNGGNKQMFLITYWKMNSLDKKSVNVTESSEDIYDAEVSDLIPSTSYIFQIKAKNVEGFSDSVNNTIDLSTKDITETKSSIIGPVAGAVGGIVAAGLFVVGVVVFRRKYLASGKRTDRKQLTFAAPEVEEGDEGGLKDNELYVSAGEHFTESSTATGDVYAVIMKQNEKKAKSPVEETGLYAEVVKKKDKSKTENVSTNVTKTKTGNHITKKKTKKEIDGNGDVYENITKQNIKSTPKTKNKDGLVYADLVFNDDGKRKFIIRGIDNRTDYADIDLDLKADPLPSDESDEENGKNTEKVDLNKEK